MSDIETEQMHAVIGLIVNAGNARRFAKEAIDAARKKNFTEARSKLDRSECGRKSLFLRRHKFIDYVSYCFP